MDPWRWTVSWASHFGARSCGTANINGVTAPLANASHLFKRGDERSESETLIRQLPAQISRFVLPSTFRRLFVSHWMKRKQFLSIFRPTSYSKISCILEAVLPLIVSRCLSSTSINGSIKLCEKIRKFFFFFLVIYFSVLRKNPTWNKRVNKRSYDNRTIRKWPYITKE